MSGALGGLGTAIGTGVRLGQGVAQSYHALTNLLGGGDSPQPGTVQVGSVNLSAFACPEQIPFGGTQMATVHKLPGGMRVIDAMGPDDMALRWSGIMLGPDAVSQARALDLIRQKGVIVPISWDDFDYDALVVSFEADYKRAGWMGQYRLEAVIQSDYSGPQPSGGLLGGLLGGTALGGALGAVGGALGDAASAVGSVVQTVQQTVGAVASVITPITSALGIHVPFLGAVESGLSQVSGLANAVGGISGGLSALNGGLGELNAASSAGLATTGDTLGSVVVTDASSLSGATALAGAQAGYAYAAQTTAGAAVAVSAATDTPVVSTTTQTATATTALSMPAPSGGGAIAAANAAFDNQTDHSAIDKATGGGFFDTRPGYGIGGLLGLN